MTLEIRYPNPGYRLSDSARSAIAKLFDQDLVTALAPDGAITTVEQAIFATLEQCEQRAVTDSERKSPQSLATNKAQKKRAKRIGKLTAELKVLLAGALRESMSTSMVKNHQKRPCRAASRKLKTQSLNSN